MMANLLEACRLEMAKEAVGRLQVRQLPSSAARNAATQTHGAWSAAKWDERMISQAAQYAGVWFSFGAITLANAALARRFQS